MVDPATIRSSAGDARLQRATHLRAAAAFVTGIVTAATVIGLTVPVVVPPS
jgi:hypothetical protein